MIQDITSLLLRAQAYGLNLVTDKAEFDQSGLDFLVLHARDDQGLEWVVRTPRHPKAWQGSLNEARILNVLRDQLPVAVPHWKIHEPDLIAYPRLPGTPAWTYDPQEGLRWNGLNVAEPEATFKESSARFLAQLHLMDKPRILAAGGRQKSIQDVRQKLLETCESTREVLQPSPAVWQRWMSWLNEDSYWPRESALIHGDFHPGHMLLDESLRLVGVLDWTEAEIADSTADFAIFFACFGESQLQSLLKLYEEAGGRTYERMSEHIMERWAVNAAISAEWALDHHHEAVLNFAKERLAALESQMRELRNRP